MVNSMKKNKTYQIFLFLSTFTRGLVEVFSLVLLYKKGVTINNILWFLFSMYSFGIIINYITLKYSYKIILIISSLLYGISFLYLSFMNTNILSIIILSFLLASANYSFHALKHLLALELIEDSNKSTNKIITITYLGVIVSSITGIYLIEKLNLTITSIIIFILSFISIIPILKLNNKTNKYSKTNLTKIKIPKNKIIFNILEQFKVIFLEIQPLFLYIYIDKSISYVGIFNIIVNLASLIVVYFIAKRFSKKYFKINCFLLSIVLILKLNINNGIILLILAFFEGIFVKLYENISLNNLYTINNNSIREYLIIEEFIFFSTKSIIILIFNLLKLNIHNILYISIIGIILSSLFIKKEDKIN